MTIGELKEYLEAKISGAVGSIIEFTPISRTSADGSSDGVSMQTDEKDRERPVRRLSVWGVSGRPMTGVLAGIMKAVGGAFGGMYSGIATDKYGPQNLKPGETCVWNKVTGTRIYLDENGKIAIDAAAGQDIVLNGGTLQVARKTDKVVLDATMATWVAAVTARFNAAPAPMLSAPGTLTPPIDFGIINGGAPHVLG